MRWMCRESMQLRRPGMSSPDRREIARIHTGGVCDPQYSEAPAFGAFLRVGGRVEINDKAPFRGGALWVAALRHLIVSGVPSLRMGRVTAIMLVNRQLS